MVLSVRVPRWKLFSKHDSQVIYETERRRVIKRQRRDIAAVSDERHLKLQMHLILFSEIKSRKADIWSILIRCNKLNYILVAVSTERHQIEIYSGLDKKNKRSLPAVLTESRDEVTLLVFRIQEENRPVQGALLVQDNLSPRDLLRAEAVQAQLWHRCWGAFVLILAVWTMPTTLHRLEELDASILRKADKKCIW